MCSEIHYSNEESWGYWPKFFNDQAIKFYMADKEVGTQLRLPGQIYGISFEIFAMKEPVYAIMLMSTYEKLVVSGGKN